MFATNHSTFEGKHRLEGLFVGLAGLTAMAKSQEAKDLKKLGLLLLEY